MAPPWRGSRALDPEEWVSPNRWCLPLPMNSPHSCPVARQRPVVVQVPSDDGRRPRATATGRLLPYKGSCAMFLDASRPSVPARSTRATPIARRAICKGEGNGRAHRVRAAGVRLSARFVTRAAHTANRFTAGSLKAVIRPRWTCAKNDRYPVSSALRAASRVDAVRKCLAG